MLFSAPLSGTRQIVMVSVNDPEDPDDLLTETEEETVSLAFVSTLGLNRKLDVLQNRDFSTNGGYHVFISLDWKVKEIRTLRFSDSTGVEITLFYRVLDKVNSRTLAEGPLPAIGQGENFPGAFNSALADIQRQLEEIFLSLPELDEPGKLLLVEGKTLLFESADFPGAGPGDELEDAGDPSSLVLLKERLGNTLFARSVYGEPKKDTTYTLVHRIGFDLEYYGGVSVSSPGGVSALSGTRLRLPVGSARIFPLVGTEILFLQDEYSRETLLLPYIGLQYIFSLGRVDISPLGAAGVGSSITGDNPGEISCAGGFGAVQLSLRLGRSLSVVLEGGYSSWLDLNGIADDGSYGYNGVRAAGGLIWKF